MPLSAKSSPSAVACDLCESTRSSFLFESRDGDYFRCADCGLIYGISEENGLDALYDGIYDDQIAVDAAAQFRRPVRWHRNVAKRLGRLEPFRSTGKFLEIGCGCGDFLGQAAQAGWETVGVELSDTAARFARDRRGLDVRTGTVETLGGELPLGEFDVVYADNLLEHVLSPASFMAGIEPLLRPGGVLVFSTLNAASWAFRLTGKDWEYVPSARVHRYVFSPKTLERYCANHHLSVVRTETFGFRAISKYAEKRWYSGLIRPLEKTLAEAARWVGQGHRIEISAVKNAGNQIQRLSKRAA